MPRVNFKGYLAPAKEHLPSDLEVVVATYGPYLSLNDAATCIKRDRRTVEKLIKSGDIPASRTSKSGFYIIAATDLVRFIHKSKIACN
ncbi:helix-turn-helix domain-containing protein [Ethanoligenens harbinense]|uniref:Helix-turn-helix domain-containing protein n=1 Tax=Ethanoligenens harbinense (strain DSM 18485 / JCM 12961 / CGMCC 1.5033 / YUAN-3) TaxID=663278 RepID=E6U5A7_ETHHY|nr:helix-turn-helix domain-containing protein [Ethanoligenens harbinense]ADU27920.1 hypothetical protein Ethha_2424 [Ethanoligenens harbinense YUAN-3]AVQ96948.1 DNA-binding protein [Ethanoligenens harbinense YUAN-3]AYF39608.1 DNA-binding protein [Ethanoligenens harbinense]AYF42436.1 DNA-binding protein [Ethanoligenens harbinense]QCN93189.1 DNA-binding protein [Ethanoligenens harbinense]